MPKLCIIVLRGPMSLKRKFLLRDWALVFGLALVGAASLWGLDGLRRQVHVTQSAYADMTLVQSASELVRQATDELTHAAPDVPAAGARLDQALVKTNTFIADEIRNYNTSGAQAATTRLQAARRLLSTKPSTVS